MDNKHSGQTGGFLHRASRNTIQNKSSQCCKALQHFLADFFKNDSVFAECLGLGHPTVPMPCVASSVTAASAKRSNPATDAFFSSIELSGALSSHGSRRAARQKFGVWLAKFAGSVVIQALPPHHGSQLGRGVRGSSRWSNFEGMLSRTIILGNLLHQLLVLVIQAPRQKAQSKTFQHPHR